MDGERSGQMQPKEPESVKPGLRGCSCNPALGDHLHLGAEEALQPLQFAAS